MSTDITSIKDLDDTAAKRFVSATARSFKGTVVKQEALTVDCAVATLIEYERFGLGTKGGTRTVDYMERFGIKSSSQVTLWRRLGTAREYLGVTPDMQVTISGQTETLWSVLANRLGGGANIGTVAEVIEEVDDKGKHTGTVARIVEALDKVTERTDTGALKRVSNRQPSTDKDEAGDKENTSGKSVAEVLEDMFLFLGSGKVTDYLVDEISADDFAKFEAKYTAVLTKAVTLRSQASAKAAKATAAKATPRKRAAKKVAA